MTQDEIIEMARQAGFDISKPNRIIVRHSNGSWISIKFELEAFAKLVAEAASSKEKKKWEDQTDVEIHEAVLEEREACAKHLDNQNTEITDILAAEIRARGEA